MAVLNSLPNELLVDILSALNCFDLARVSQVSWRLNIVVEPLLYHDVSLGTRRPSLYVFQHFLRSVLSRPVLASYVRLLTISWESPLSPPDARFSNKPLSVAAARVGLRYPLHSQGAEIALLLHLLPRLTTLDLSPPAYFDVLDDFLTTQPYLPRSTLAPSLQSLHTIHYRGAGCIAVDLATLLALLTLPALRTLDIGFIDLECASSAPPAATTVSSSRVTDLRFGFDDASPALLAQVLRIPRALTRLSFEQLGRGDGFSRALETVRGSLEYLVVRMEGDETVGSLRRCVALRHVRCSMAALVGRVRDGETLARVLPVAIVGLWVEVGVGWGFGEVLRVVEGLVRGRRGFGLVGLQVVVVEREWAQREVDGEGVRRACEAVGVKLVVRDVGW